MHNKIIAVASVKGGSGKTSEMLAINAELTHRGYETRVYDGDLSSPMVHAYSGLDNHWKKSIGPLLSGEFKLEDVRSYDNGTWYVLGTTGLDANAIDSKPSYLHNFFKGVIAHSDSTFNFLDLSAGNYRFTRKGLLLANIVLFVLPTSQRQFLINGYQQFKTIYEAYQAVKLVPEMPRFVIIANHLHEHRGDNLNAKEMVNGFTEAAKIAKLFEQGLDKNFILGAMDIPYVRDTFDASLLKNEVPRPIRHQIKAIADLLELAPVGRLSAEDRLNQVLYPLEAREKKG